MHAAAINEGTVALPPPAILRYHERTQHRTIRPKATPSAVDEREGGGQTCQLEVNFDGSDGAIVFVRAMNNVALAKGG